MYKSKTSEIGEKYSISKDEVFLYFYQYTCEFLINDELIKGNIHDIENAAYDLSVQLRAKQDTMSERNKKIPYKCYIYTNNILRATLALGMNEHNSELMFAKAGKHTRGQLFKVIGKEHPFIIVNVQPLACNRLEQIEAEGVYKIKKAMEFNCSIANLDLHHLGQTIGRNVEKIEGRIIRDARKKDENFYLPRLFSYKHMCSVQWEGQNVRNYNLLQCANMAGLLALDPDETFNIKPMVISFDIKTAYMSVLINQPIFPHDLTVVDIDPQAETLDYMGNYHHTNAFEVTDKLLKRLRTLKAKRKWFFVSVDPNYNGDNKEVIDFLNLLNPFRRNWEKHPGAKLKYVNQEQVVCFLEYDIAFYDEYYSNYMELTFEEMFYHLLLMCPDAKIVLMYSKQKSDYLPKEFRDSKMELFKLREQQEKDTIERDIAKHYHELTYGKGLQLRDYQSDEEVIKAVTNETINIAMSLTCCSYTRYRLIHDWQGFTPLYMDSDSIKFQFGFEKNNFAALIQRYNELAAVNSKICELAGYPDFILGQWCIDGIYDYMIFLKKKCYIGYRDDATTEIKLSGCDRAAYQEHFKDGTLNLLREIEDSKQLTIKHGKKKKVLLRNNEYEYYKYEDVTYSKNKLD